MSGKSACGLTCKEASTKHWTNRGLNPTLNVPYPRALSLSSHGNYDLRPESSSSRHYGCKSNNQRYPPTLTILIPININTIPTLLFKLTVKPTYRPYPTQRITPSPSPSPCLTLQPPQSHIHPPTHPPSQTYSAPTHRITRQDPQNRFYPTQKTPHRDEHIIAVWLSESSKKRASISRLWVGCDANAGRQG